MGDEVGDTLGDASLNEYDLGFLSDFLLAICFIIPCNVKQQIQP